MSRAFEFCAGTPALNLVDTVASREGQPHELLRSPSELDKWLRLAGFAYEPVTAATADDLGRARELREAVYRCANAVLEGGQPAKDTIETLNRFAREPGPSAQWIGGKVVLKSPAFFDAVFSVIAADAIQRLSEDQRPRLRKCPDCKMLFFDSSRPGKRIWCSSTSGCGNRAKVRRHRARKSQA